MKKWIVTFTSWRETWSGHDQNDGERERVVKARNEKQAISKVKRDEFGGKFSHSIRGTDWNAERV